MQPVKTADMVQMMGIVIKVRNKIKETRAFTIAEALVAIIIVLLVSSIVAIGIPAAANAYENIVVRSNAELLLSNTLTSLRNELSMARDITVEGNTITYYNEMFGTYSKIEGGFDNNDKPLDIKYQRFAKDPLVFEDESNVKGSNIVNFVQEEISDKDYGMHVGFKSVAYSDGVVTFSDVTVTKGDNKKPTAVSRGSYSIRVITD